MINIQGLALAAPVLGWKSWFQQFYTIYTILKPYMPCLMVLKKVIFVLVTFFKATKALIFLKITQFNSNAFESIGYNFKLILIVLFKKSCNLYDSMRHKYL